MLKGKIIKIIDGGFSPKVKYVCRGEGNLVFVCGEKRWLYEFSVHKFGDIAGWKIEYDEMKDRVIGIQEY